MKSIERGVNALYAADSQQVILITEEGRSSVLRSVGRGGPAFSLWLGSWPDRTELTAVTADLWVPSVTVPPNQRDILPHGFCGYVERGQAETKLS